MAVRRIGRPIARWGEHFGHQKAAGHIAPLHGDVVDIARICALPARGKIDPLRAKARGGVIGNRGGGANGNRAIRCGQRLPRRCGRKIQTMGGGFFKHIQPPAQKPPILASAVDMNMAFNNNQNRLAVWGQNALCGVTRLQAVQIKPNIAPARRLRR